MTKKIINHSTLPWIIAIFVFSIWWGIISLWYGNKQTITATIIETETRYKGLEEWNKKYVHTDVGSFSVEDRFFLLKNRSFDTYGELKRNVWVKCDLVLVWKRVGIFNKLQNVIEAYCI